MLVSARLASKIIACSIMLAPSFTGLAMGADQLGLPEAQSVSPLRRGPNGDIEAVVPSKGGIAVACQKASPGAGEVSPNKLRALLPGHWMEVGNSHLASVAYNGPMP